MAWWDRPESTVTEKLKPAELARLLSLVRIIGGEDLFPVLQVV
jgi:hypothetical protein